VPAKNPDVSDAGERVSDRQEEVAGLPTFWHEAPATGAPALYLHGVPTSSDDFVPFLRRVGGAAPDLPGFGRSGKPAGFDYSIAGIARHLEAFVDVLGWDRFSLVVHDWGAVGLAMPDAVLRRVERLVIVNAVPLLPGYRWHRVARLWRTPLVGELTMGFTTKWGMKRGIREAFVADRATSDALIDPIWTHFDHGTQRAILKLYRSAPPDELARGGSRLRTMRCPALVVWGTRDPYLPTSFAQAYVDALEGPARLKLLDDAGHWPWLDRSDTLELVGGFLEG
jgi:pimeloyl-ACP methyl ester carboxylesterase